MPEAISDKTVISLKLNSWFQIVTVIVVVLGAYFAIKSDVTKATDLSKQNAQDIKDTQKGIYDMQMNIKDVSDNVRWFREQYEKDMKRYIREK